MFVNVEAVRSSGAKHEALVDTAQTVAKGIETDGSGLSSAIADGAVAGAFDAAVAALSERVVVLSTAIGIGAEGLNKAADEYEKTDESTAASGHAQARGLAGNA